MGSSKNCCPGKSNTLSGFVLSTSLMPSNFVSQNGSKHVHGVYAFGLFPHPKNMKIKVHMASKATENQQSIKYPVSVRRCVWLWKARFNCLNLVLGETSWVWPEGKTMAEDTPWTSGEIHTILEEYWQVDSGLRSTCLFHCCTLSYQKQMAKQHTPLWNIMWVCKPQEAIHALATALLI